MSQTNVQTGSVSMPCGADLTAHADHLAVLSHSGGVPKMILPASLTAPALYVVLAGAPSGENGDFHPLTPDRNVRLPLVGTCNPGDTLVIANPSVTGQPGKVCALPATAGTYRAIGIAEAKGISGQLILVRPANLGLITVA
ncbi:MAG: hypothetical protein HOO88_05680 [Kiritimatiellaceae bacterium]|nr:hypothetical protein [Kiritimatiellaceae bacterium]